MGAPIPCLGHRSQTAAAMAMLDGGLDHRAVAARIGTSVHRVRTIESNARARGWIAGPAAGDRIGEPMPEASIALSALVPANSDLRIHARREAARRGMSIERLVRSIVETVITEKLVDAVLDDALAKRNAP